MTREEQDAFDAWVMTQNLTKDQKEWLENFIERVEEDAFERAVVAEFDKQSLED